MTGCGRINIKFSNGIIDDVDNGYTKQPAFYFGEYTEAIDSSIQNRNTGYNPGGQELKGIWVAKYQISIPSAGDKFQSKPGYQELNAQNVNYYFDTAKKIAKENTEYYKLTTGQLDSFMMRNRDWGAVTYLAQAIGKQNQIEANTNYSSGGSANVNDVYTTNVLKSCTGTSNGIYDMAGSTEDFMAAYTDNGVDNGSSLYNADPRYKDVFTMGTGDSTKNNLNRNKNKKGMAMTEVCNPNISGVWGLPQSWRTGIMYIPEAGNGNIPSRGADVTHAPHGITGMYSMYSRSQAGAGYLGSRTVIVNVK